MARRIKMLPLLDTALDIAWHEFSKDDPPFPDLESVQKAIGWDEFLDEIDRLKTPERGPDFYDTDWAQDLEKSFPKERYIPMRTVRPTQEGMYEGLLREFEAPPLPSFWGLGEARQAWRLERETDMRRRAIPDSSRGQTDPVDSHR